MANHSTIPSIQTTHAALISAMGIFYRTLLDLDYLREEEVQFPPHTDENKTPLTTASVEAANLTPDVQSLLHYLPYITEAGKELGEGEAAITLHSQPVSYLHKGSDVFDNGERLFGYADGGDEALLPLWAILLFSGTNRDQHVVAYDTRSRKVAELDMYSPTVQEFEAAAMEVDELLGTWIRNLQAFAWIPWRDEDRFLGMQVPPSSEQRSWLADPEKRRGELLERLPVDEAEERFTSDMRSAREDWNCYCAKRAVYERAGWPGGLATGRLREGVRELEQALWDAWDGAMGVEQEEEAERGVYGRSAGGVVFDRKMPARISRRIKSDIFT